MAPRFEISESEVFPVYEVVERKSPSHVDPEVTLTDEELADYDRVSEEWLAWQERLKGLRQVNLQSGSTGRHVESPND